MGEGATILFQPINGVGLGHISRLAAIALAVRERSPEAFLPFVVSGGSHAFVEALDLPCISVGGKLGGWPRERFDGFITEISRAIVRQLQPQAIVFDLIAIPQVLRVAAEERIPVALVIRKAKQMEKLFGALAPHEKLIRLFLFPHEPGEFEAPAWMAGRAHFVGPVARPERGGAREKAGASRKMIVVTGGGGGFPETVDFYNVALRAIAELGETIADHEVRLVTGPLFKDWHRLELIGGARVIPFEPDMISLWDRASLVLCQAGYNTVAEVVRSGVPVICVPAPRDLDDQFERAQEIASAHPQVETWTGTDAGSLSALIARMLRADAPARATRQSPPGAGAAADLLLDLVRS